MKAAAAILALLGINLYICREAFFVEHTGYMNSMHGFWMALARLADQHWFTPAWWPYWDAGMPFEHTYAPLAPALTAAIAKLGGMPISRAFHMLSGAVYCLGPVGLFWMAWRLSGALGYSFAAGVVYSLTAPTELLVPDSRFRLAAVGDARRLYLAFVWDEVPHLAALLLACLALVFLDGAAEKRSRGRFIAAVLTAAAAVLANPFGAAALAAGGACLLVARRRAPWLAAVAGALAYLVACPFLPPSLIETIRFNAAGRAESGWWAGSWIALAAVIAGGGLLAAILRRLGTGWFLEFAALLAWAGSSLPLLETYFSVHFLPQPNRYKLEMEIVLVLLAVFAVRPYITRLRRGFRILLCAGLVLLAADRAASHRRYARTVLREVDIRQTVEHRLARWTEEHLPGQRVMMPGSLAQWLNAFSSTPQLTGGSFPTALNWSQQIAGETVVLKAEGTPHPGWLATLWLKAFGVQAVAVSGPRSEEFWKPYENPRQFEGYLPVLWREKDTTLYGVPQRSTSLAHIVPAGSLVQRAPRHGRDVAEVERYAAALEDASMPAAELRWYGPSQAVIEIAAASPHPLSVQINHHPGWRAEAGGRRIAVDRDGLGLIRLDPRCQGPCRVTLRYGGGWEQRLCRWLSLLALAGLACAAALPGATRAAAVRGRRGRGGWRT